MYKLILFLPNTNFELYYSSISYFVHNLFRQRMKVHLFTGFLAGAKVSRGVHLRSASIDDKLFGCSFVLTGSSEELQVIETVETVNTPFSGQKWFHGRANS